MQTLSAMSTSLKDIVDRLTLLERTIRDVSPR
jgi:hypothetical protein